MLSFHFNDEFLPIEKITPTKLQRHVNTIIIPGLGLDLNGSKISEWCARRWLQKLGYDVTEVKKGVYVDGHERPDVVEYRKKFIAEIKANDQYVAALPFSLM